MQNNTIRKNVPPGTHVLIVKKEDQRTDKLTEGIVKKSLLIQRFTHEASRFALRTEQWAGYRRFVRSNTE